MAPSLREISSRRTGPASPVNSVGRSGCPPEPPGGSPRARPFLPPPPAPVNKEREGPFVRPAGSVTGPGRVAREGPSRRPGRDSGLLLRRARVVGRIHIGELERTHPRDLDFRLTLAPGV